MKRLHAGGQLYDVDPERLGAEAVDWLLGALSVTSGISPLARRIGPIYAVEDLARWLVPPGRAALTSQGFANVPSIGSWLGS